MEKETIGQDIKFDIANALYIISPKLGEKYEKEKESPFDDDFVLTQAFAKEILDGAKDKSKVEQPEFLKQGNKEVSAHFEKSVNATGEVIKGLINKLYSGEFALGIEDNLEEEIKRIIDILKVRKKMLENAIEELKNSRADSFALYKDIVSISKNVSEIMSRSFEEEIDKEIAIEQFIMQCREKEKLRKMQASIINSKSQENAPKIPEKQFEEIQNKHFENNAEYVENKEDKLNENFINNDNLSR